MGVCGGGKGVVSGGEERGKVREGGEERGEGWVTETVDCFVVLPYSFPRITDELCGLLSAHPSLS